MDTYEKEIPFGAFDSELMHQEIFIPEGFEATIDGDKIILTRKDSEDEKIRKFLIKWIQDNYYHGTTEIPTKTLIAWLENQGEQKPIMNVPPREVILSIWDLGNEWKELTNGSISTEYGTQLNYIQKHWHESEYYLREKQGEQKSSDEDMKEALRTEYEKGRADAFAQMQKEWSEEDEVKINRIVACLENLNVADNDILLKDVDWLKSLKDRVKSQNTWKPSDGQIRALEYIINNAHNTSYSCKIAKELLEQLRRLKGE